MTQSVSLDNHAKTWLQYLKSIGQTESPYRSPNTMPYTPKYTKPPPQQSPQQPGLTPLLVDLAEGHKALMSMLGRLSEQLEALEARVDELAHGE